MEKLVRTINTLFYYLKIGIGETQSLGKTPSYTNGTIPYHTVVSTLPEV